jgi:DNA-binding transcriptional regulator YbjK
LPVTASRLELIGDATIEILAGQGMRGLTHRAVDRQAGLPLGTTSNYARTRVALLELSLARMTQLEAAVTELIEQPPASLAQLADQIADGLHYSMTRARVRIIARYELALEATRRPQLRAAYDQIGLSIRRGAEDVLTAIGSADPAAHARFLVSWAEGALFYALAGAGQANPPTRDELRAQAAAILNALVT